MPFVKHFVEYLEVPIIFWPLPRFKVTNCDLEDSASST
jgi:hypothetical protein